MGYALGIDLGTTWSAAAVVRNGRAEVASLGTHTAAVPSVVFLRPDGEVLVGEPAERRGAAEPARVAHEFKRRLGDSVPVLVGGSPIGVDALMGHLLAALVERVVAMEGGDPDHAVVTHPANWGPYKLDLLRQAIRSSGLDRRCPTTLLSEPEAAAAHYAATERVPTGATVAVYDLGGGTFDAAVLRKTDEGYDVLGTPEGIERLGGIDFDAAVLGHVDAETHGAVSALDPSDADEVATAAELKRRCVEAKEALSADTDAIVPVLVAGRRTEVRITRGELETMLRPALHETVAALQRAIEAAGTSPAGLQAVLLVGGSSRIPLVAQLVGALGAPVAVDAHPKHAIALGAALVAARRATPEPVVAPTAAWPPAAAFAAPVPEPEPLPRGAVAAEHRR